MATTTHRRLVNPLLGTYFGIFTSALACLVLLVLIFEQLGVGGPLLRLSMLIGPIALYLLIGAAALTSEPIEYFASGRRVPAVYAGLGLMSSTVGATGMVAITGLFFLNGFDAWCLAIGFWAGFVAMVLLIAPYLRKFGAYTVASYLGRRFDSRLLRLAAAATLLAPMLLIAAAELRMGAFAAAWLTGVSRTTTAFLLAASVLAIVSLGGMRSLNWSNTAQAIAALLALTLPVAILAAHETNLPLPQLTHGPVLRAIGRLEAMQNVPMPVAPSLAIDFAGDGLRALGHRVAHPYATVGPVAFILLSLTVMCGVAAAPWLLPRCGCTPGVYETRKAGGWAIVFCGLVMLTSASIAVFMRNGVMHDLVSRTASELPEWFERLRGMGLAGVADSGQSLGLTNFSFHRDAVLFALPLASGFPEVVLYMALAGAVAAALLGSSAAIVAIGNMLAEDGVTGLLREPPPARLRVTIARASIAAACVLAGWIAMFIPADPLDLMLWGLSISASASFPVIVLSIWWKRLNAFGAVIGMSAGFWVAVLAILAGEAAWLGLSGMLAAVIGVPAGFASAMVASRAAPRPDRRVLGLVRDMRLPGGETMEDREGRLQRLKTRRGP
jgi:cation/acetate symporter